MNNYNKQTDRVICPICSGEFKSLSHHIKSHKIHLSDFKDKYPDARMTNSSYSSTIASQQSSRVSESTKKYLEELDKDHVKCPICGVKRKSLTHHLRAHGISKDEFLKEYPGYTMMSRSTRDQYSEKGLATVNYINSNPDITQKRLVNLRKASKLRWSTMTDSEMEIIRDRMRSVQKYSTELYKSDESYRSRVRKSKSKSASSRSRETSKMFTELWRDPEYIAKMKNRKSYSSGLSEKGFRSSYEDRMSIILDSLGITYLYEPFVVKYDHQGRTRLYTPDFYLPQYNLIIEIKPIRLLDNPMNRDKMVGCLIKGYRFMFVCEWELFNDSSNLSDILRSSSTIETYSVSTEKYFLKGVE